MTSKNGEKRINELHKLRRKMENVRQQERRGDREIIIEYRGNETAKQEVVDVA